MITLGVMMVCAASPSRSSGAELLQDVRKLSVVGTVLYVAAHPDDENTRFLAAMANQQLVRTAYLSFTRGEGGQNLIGSELGAGLGAIRTQELLAARRIDGAEQYFTRARDFGYSKSVDETLAVWDHDRVLADAVWVIRSLQPDVIVTRFALEGGDTHGHHTASARLAVEAFTAAADPKFHPEQLATVKVWQPTRIVWNAWRPDGKSVPEGVDLDVSPYSPLLGTSFGELAAESRSMHKSQGFGAAQLHGSSVERFVHLAGAPMKSTLFDGVDLSWKRVAGSTSVSALITELQKRFDPAAPYASVPLLAKTLKAVRALPPSPWRTHTEASLASLIVKCSGLHLKANAKTFTRAPGQALDVETVALLRTPAELSLVSVSINDESATAPQPLVRGKELTQSLTVKAPSTFSSPYWAQRPPGPGTWTLGEDAPLGAPEAPAPFRARFELETAGVRVPVERPVVFTWVEPTMGERERVVEVLPPVVLTVEPPLLVFTGQRTKPVKVTVRALVDGQRGSVTLAGTSQPFELSKSGDSTTVRFELPPTAGVLEAVANVDGQSWSTSLQRIEYPHVPPHVLLQPATVKVLPVALSRGKTTRVGYVPGAGDDVAAALTEAGYSVTVLNDAELLGGDLSRFDALVIGIRAYNVSHTLASAYPRLMKYVEQGGTVVAQYATKNWLSNVPAQVGPFPFEISRDRVTDETAAPTLAKHRVFESPNRITAADFEGWVQERGLYFAEKVDPRYEAPLSLADPNEKPSTGALIIATHGKGRFIYTGLAFFRQLPAGVPGAFRLFANLLDHGR